MSPVDAVIVNWNGRRYLPGCIRALRASTRAARIVVVDNASTDGSVEMLRREYPEVERVETGGNIGYAAGANAGLRATSGEYAIVLNPDVALAPDHLATLVSRLDADATIGAAQGKLYSVSPEDFAVARFDRGGRLDSAGHAIRRTRMVVDRGQGKPDGPEYSREESVFSACGAALLLRRAMLRDLAPDGDYFDPEFFAYKEDIDLCWRARLLGWDVRYVPAAVAWHVRGWAGSAAPDLKSLPLAARMHSFKNHYLLLLKNERPADALRSLPALAGWEALRLGYAVLRDPALFRAYASLLRVLRPELDRRRDVMSRRRAPDGELRRWLGRPE